MLLLSAILAVHAAEAACPADAVALRADVEAATRAYEDWAWEDFDQAVVAVWADLGCLAEVVTAADAQSAHLLFALVGARGQDEARAVAAFRGQLALEPGFEPDLVLAPVGSLLRRAWEQARAPAAGQGQVLCAGAWFLDGKPGASELPAERAAVVQLLDADTGFLSWYLDGGELPPGLAERLAPAAAAQELPEPVPADEKPPPAELPAAPLVEPERGGHASRGLLVSGLALAAAGVGSLAAGEALENQMMEAQHEARAQSLYRLGLVSSFGGLALGAAGSGLVLGAVVKGRW